MIPFEVLPVLPAAEGDPREQARRCLRGLGGRTPLALTFFVLARDRASFDAARAAVKGAVKELYGTEHPPVSVVAQAPEEERSVALEATVLAPGAEDVVVRHRQSPNLGSPYTLLEGRGVRQIHAAGLTAAPDLEDPEDQARIALDDLSALLRAEGMDFGDVIRQWNYVEGILRVEPRTSRQGYQVFCDQRGLVYEASAFPAGYPAATGIGQAAGGVVLECIALKAPPEVRVEPISNPRQVDAHRYSTGVLVGKPIASLPEKTAPKFERAKRVRRGDEELILVSGAAAIIGEESVAPGDVRAQTATALENIAELTPGGRLTHLRAYVKHASDIPVVREVCTAAHAGVPALYVEADVCRDELLVEIEGAFVGRIGGEGDDGGTPVG